MSHETPFKAVRNDSDFPILDTVAVPPQPPFQGTELPALNAPRHVLPGFGTRPGASCATATSTGNDGIPVVSAQPVNLSATNGGSAGPPLQSTLTPSFVMAPLPDSYETQRRCFECVVKCRWIAGFILFYYLITFLFLQPIFISTMGILTGFCGIVACREPIDGTRLKWLRAFIYMHYMMAGFNVALVLAVGVSSTQYNRDGTTNNLHPMLCFALIVTTNLLLHFRGERAARMYLAELLQCTWVVNGATSDPAAVLVVTQV